MSVDQVQEAVSSIEFTEWMAFYTLEAELMLGVEPDPTPDELSDKFAAAFRLHNAKNAR